MSTRAKSNIQKQNKNNNTSDELQKLIQDIKESFKYQMAEMTAYFDSKINDVIGELKGTIKNLKQELTDTRKELDFVKSKQSSNINQLHEKIDCMQQESYANTIVLSGETVNQSIKEFSGHDQSSKRPSLSETSKRFLIQKLGVDEDLFSIIEAKRLGQKPLDGQQDVRPLEIKLDDSLAKNAVFKAVLSKRVNNVYISEKLTTRRMALRKHILEIKNNTKLSWKVFSIYGVIHIKVHDGKIYKVYNERTMETFLSKINLSQD